jgi:hypothetical protein
MEPLKKKKKKKKKAVAPHPAPAHPHFANPELETLFNRFHQMDDEIKAKLNRVYELSGFSPKKLAEAFENPELFEPKMWEKLQQEKVRIHKEMAARGLGKKVVEKVERKKEDELTKKRKGKMLGLRKKWIPMQ